MSVTSEMFRNCLGVMLETGRERFLEFQRREMAIHTE